MNKLPALMVFAVILGISCAPASTGREVTALQEQVAVLQAQYRGLEAKVAEEKTRSCKALYLAAFAAERVGVLEQGAWSVPDCPTWEELNR